MNNPGDPESVQEQEGKKENKNPADLLRFTGTKGTREWSDESVNIAHGCHNGCRYCYAWADEKRRRSGSKQAKKWTVMKLNLDGANKEYKPNKKGRVMFPTTHDIVDLPRIRGACMDTLGKLLKAYREVLVTTKPRLSIIQEIHQKFQKQAKRLQFRFTITSTDNDLLRFWEPNAPRFEERLEALRYAQENGYKTSVSCEPFLDPDPGGVIDAVDPYVTESIWIGCMNRIKATGFKKAKEEVHYAEVRKHYELENLKRIYDTFFRREKIQFKDSFENALNNAAKRLPCAELLVESIVVKDQVRNKKSVDTDTSIEELADSIKHDGLIEPIVVQRTKDDGLVLLVGSRRLRAYQMLHEKTIPAFVVEEKSKEEALRLQLSENLQRKRLKPMEEAKACRNYLTARLGVEVDLQKLKSDVETYTRDRERLERLDGRTVEAIDDLMRVFGKSSSTIWRRLKLLGLRPDVQEEVRKGNLNVTQALVFAGKEEHPDLTANLKPAVEQMLPKEAIEHPPGEKPQKKKGQRPRKGVTFALLEQLRDLHDAIPEQWDRMTLKEANALRKEAIVLGRTLRRMVKQKKELKAKTPKQPEAETLFTCSAETEPRADVVQTEAV